MNRELPAALRQPLEQAIGRIAVRPVGVDAGRFVDHQQVRVFEEDQVVHDPDLLRTRQ